jgi:hypothetical protein
MAISPNDTFTTGQVLTSAEANAFPFGVVGRAVSNTDYTLTTSYAIATGMTVTFTAIANRYYKITYMEPQCQTSTVANTDTNIAIRVTNAAGTLLNAGFVRTETGSQQDPGTITLVTTSTFTAGSVTIVGCAKTGSTTGTPVLGRNASIAGAALLLVEDIGPA